MTDMKFLLTQAAMAASRENRPARRVTEADAIPAMVGCRLGTCSRLACSLLDALGEWHRTVTQLWFLPGVFFVFTRQSPKTVTNHFPRQ